MISVIVPSYNSEGTIRECLDSLQNQSFTGDYEVVLVDSSVDATAPVVSSDYPNIKFIHLDKKTDPGTARNIGIKEAKGDLLAFIDADCVAKHDWLEKIALAHRSPYNVVGGAVNIGNEKNDTVGYAGYIAEFREFLPILPKREVGHIPTCNISYKKKVFEQFGLFEGKYYPQEDLIFNYNLRKKGERILCDPAIQVYHRHRSNLKDYLSHQKKIGAVTAKVLKVTDLNGTFITRNPTIAILLIPFLPIIKFTRTLIAFLRYQPKMVLKRPLVIFLFAIGLVYWAVGFAYGTYTKTYS